jgi:hypothetical protein
MERKLNNIQISWGQRNNQMMSYRSPSKLCLASGTDKNLLMIDRRTSMFRSTKDDIVQRQSMI